MPFRTRAERVPRLLAIRVNAVLASTGRAGRSENDLSGLERSRGDRRSVHHQRSACPLAQAPARARLRRTRDRRSHGSHARGSAAASGVGRRRPPAIQPREAPWHRSWMHGRPAARRAEAHRGPTGDTAQARCRPTPGIRTAHCLGCQRSPPPIGDDDRGHRQQQQGHGVPSRSAPPGRPPL